LAHSSVDFWAMRLVTGVANHSARMVGRYHLRKSLRLGDIGLVAADAQYRHVNFGWLKRGGVVRVFREGTMTRLAGDPCMDALALQVVHISVATFASQVSREYHGTRCRIRYGCATIEAVLTEAARHKDSAQDQEQDDPDHEDRGHAEKVPSIFEICHRCSREYPIRLSIRMLDNDLSPRIGRTHVSFLDKREPPMPLCDSSQLRVTCERW